MGDFQGKSIGRDGATNTKVRITLDPDAGDILVGGNGRGGDLKVNDDKGTTKIRLDAGGVEAAVPESTTETILLAGGSGTISAASLILTNTVNQKTVTLSAGGEMSLGNNVNDFLVLKNKDGKPRINLEASGGNIWLGGNGVDGDLLLFPDAAEGADLNDSSKASIWLDGGGRRIRLRGPDLRDRIQLVAERGKIMLGGNGSDGDLLVFDADGDNETPTGPTGAKIWIKGSTGDILLQNGDCAEDFDVSESQELEPGTVMVLDQAGRLEQSKGAYDKKVAGVISGAGEYKPGIVLDKKQSQNRRLPVALLGKVYCKVDAQYSSIEVGDLLTSSPTPGHAMKAKDTLKAFGAVIGKALRPLAAGTGLIPILIALQ
ncbi:MAG TPA: hypothetical protein VKC61_22385 [Pyrinomonadaceae bacterium]|nr:hypothetical protein [Pyrinomonadaceae bacterium]